MWLMGCVSTHTPNAHCALHFQWPFPDLQIGLPLTLAENPTTSSSSLPRKTLPFLFPPCSNFPLYQLNSSSCPSPILEESTKFPVIQWDLRVQDSQEYPVPDSQNLNDFMCRVLQDPRTEHLAYEYYKKAKKGMNLNQKINAKASNKKIYLKKPRKENVKGSRNFLKLILMYMEEGLMEKTLEIVKMMKRVKVRVSDCIFCAIINGFARRRGFRAAVMVYEELISDGCEPGQEKGFDKCMVAYSSIISMYGKTGRLRDAMRLVAKMKVKGCEPNVWIYNSLLDMHGSVKNLRQVEKLWKEMKRRKVAPDKVSYTNVIKAYNEAKEFDMCVRYYHEYRINGGLIDRAMAGIMVGVFSKLGESKSC
ncbi:hypothetical protein GH714_041973 [Hevea brasiliensis]|uniref:Pentacotripeptide-repeat region of PRORP domain-containing protein n=1 Tax=Hevea brasiliensis TaxID=3981 RepID=A0A6A6MRV1_HEVBR|nr:hypothetical protein GH714_041973 [Hevea brasiliensis]